MPDAPQPDHPHPSPLPSRESGPEGQHAPRPMVSPLVPGFSVLGVEGMVGAVCDPNDPESCEVPPEILSEYLGLPGQTSTAENA